MKSTVLKPVFIPAVVFIALLVVFTFINPALSKIFLPPPKIL